jgi:branched-chain amino acid transport system substrate-binding protein
MKVKEGLRILIYFLLVSILLITSCDRDTRKSINIGCILDLTGPVAPYGNWSKNGLEFAANEINANGGIDGRKLKLIIEDGMSDPKQAVSAMNKLVTVDKVKVVIITTGSSSVLSVAPIANRNKVILFTPAASSPEITNAGDYIFRNRISGIFEVSEMARVVIEQFQLMKVALMIVNNDFGIDYGRVFRNRLKDLGGTICLEEKFEQGGKDFRTQLSKIKKKRECEAIYLVGYAVECGHILKQASELGIKLRWFSTIGIESEEVIEIAREAANGVIYTAPRFDLEDLVLREFDSTYSAEYGERANLYAANSYDAVRILAMVVDKVGYEASKIKDALYDVEDFSGVTGQTSFDENGDVRKPIMLKVIKNGEFAILRE